MTDDVRERISEVLEEALAAYGDAGLLDTPARLSLADALLVAFPVLADEPVTDAEVEAGARAHADLGPGEDWPTNEDLGGGPTGTRDDEWRDECRDIARAVLLAARGVRAQ